MEFKIAFATDNGKNFIDRHFGDAHQYDIYKIEHDSFEFIKSLSNTVDEKEEVHADPNKAKGISGLLKKENVQIVVSRVFGPNIKRIKKNFVCIITGVSDIENSFKTIHDNIGIIAEEWKKGEDRNFLKL